MERGVVPLSLLADSSRQELVSNTVHLRFNELQSTVGYVSLYGWLDVPRLADAQYAAS